MSGGIAAQNPGTPLSSGSFYHRAPAVPEPDALQPVIKVSMLHGAGQQTSVRALGTSKAASKRRWALSTASLDHLQEKRDGSHLHPRTSQLPRYNANPAHPSRIQGWHSDTAVPGPPLGEEGGVSMVSSSGENHQGPGRWLQGLACARRVLTPDPG